MGGGAARVRAAGRRPRRRRPAGRGSRSPRPCRRPIPGEAELADLWLTRARARVDGPRGARRPRCRPARRLVDLYDVWLGEPALPGQVVASVYRARRPSARRDGTAHRAGRGRRRRRARPCRASGVAGDRDGRLRPPPVHRRPGGRARAEAEPRSGWRSGTTRRGASDGPTRSSRSSRIARAPRSRTPTVVRERLVLASERAPVADPGTARPARGRPRRQAGRRLQRGATGSSPSPRRGPRPRRRPGARSGAAGGGCRRRPARARPRRGCRPAGRLRPGSSQPHVNTSRDGSSSSTYRPLITSPFP